MKNHAPEALKPGKIDLILVYQNYKFIICKLRDGLVARRLVLAQVTGVRIPVPQHEYAPVAQLDRAFGYGPKGWGFDSSRAYYHLRLKIKDKRLKIYELRLNFNLKSLIFNLISFQGAFV
jgi:hypothetical protein